MCKRGDVYFADLGADPNGSKQSGVRPVIIVSNDKANTYSPVVTVVPLTAQQHKRSQPTHVYIPRHCGGLARPSIALAEQVVAINKSQLLDYKGSVGNGSIMRKVTRALQIQIGAV